MSKIFAPFSPEQVAALNRWQESPEVHPFTCMRGHKLSATGKGWICLNCPEYRQNWAHDMMLRVEEFERPVQPKAIEKIAYIAVFSDGGYSAMDEGGYFIRVKHIAIATIFENLERLRILVKPWPDISIKKLVYRLEDIDN